MPKTIDNDLAATDYTFGFMTAVDVATDAVDRLHTTAESHDRVMILEVMGRNCGWIALYSGLAGGADIILIPEIAYRPEHIVSSIGERSSEGSKFDIIVVAEGAKREGGEESYLDKASRRLGGIAYQVAADIAEHIDLEIRVTVLGHIQRGGSPIAFDRILATRFGKAAADLCARGQFGRMVALREEKIVSVPIRDAISNPKRVDPEGEMVSTARSLGISFGDGRRWQMVDAGVAGNVEYRTLVLRPSLLFDVSCDPSIGDPATQRPSTRRPATSDPIQSPHVRNPRSTTAWKKASRSSS